MSALAPTVPRVIHPWRRLRDLVGWELRWHAPDEVEDMGVTYFEEQAISLRADLSWEERRCTVLHECLHAERGPTLEGVLAEREELAVRRETARLLTPDVHAIGEALAWAHTLAEAAEELYVDLGVLRDRLRWLHPAERHYLTRRLAEVG